MTSPYMHGASRLGKRKEQGVILIVTLIGLVVLLLAGVALVRSSQTGQGISGNISFKRDLLNQADLASGAAALSFVSTATLGIQTNQNTNQPSANYSACLLPSDPHGIPKILLDDANFTTSTDTGTSVDPSCTGAVAVTTNDITDPANAIVVRYVIDRMCLGTGSTDPVKCGVSLAGQDKGGDSGTDHPSAGPKVLFRISIRVTGPHNAQSFIQTTATA